MGRHFGEPLHFRIERIILPSLFNIAWIFQFVKSYHIFLLFHETPHDTRRYVDELRQVHYANYLGNNSIPLHDELCFEENRAMKDFACGLSGAEEPYG